MRSRWTSIGSLILSVLGIAVSAYLVWAHYQPHDLVCGVGDCLTVQTSEYATISGVSIAWLGVAMYLGLAALIVGRRYVRDLTIPASAAILLIALCGALYSAYLTYLELWVIDAICQWCVVSAVLITAILAIELGSFLTQGEAEQNGRHTALDT